MDFSKSPQDHLRHAILCGLNILVYGPIWVNKIKYVDAALVNGPEYDVISGESSLSDVRSWMNQLTRSSGYLVIDGLENLSENAQDGLLKSVEESSHRFVCISNDNGLISEALLSRFSVRIAFSSSGTGEHDSTALIPCPEMKELWRSDSSYEQLYHSVSNPEWSRNAMISATPSILKNTKLNSLEKTLVCRILSMGSRGLPHHQTLCDLSSHILKTSSLNIYQHYLASASV